MKHSRFCCCCCCASKTIMLRFVKLSFVSYYFFLYVSLRTNCVRRKGLSSKINLTNIQSEMGMKLWNMKSVLAIRCSLHEIQTQILLLYCCCFTFKYYFRLPSAFTIHLFIATVKLWFDISVDAIIIDNYHLSSYIWTMFFFFFHLFYPHFLSSHFQKKYLERQWNRSTFVDSSKFGRLCHWQRWRQNQGNQRCKYLPFYIYILDIFSFENRHN